MSGAYTEETVYGYYDLLVEIVGEKALTDAFSRYNNLIALSRYLTENVPRRYGEISKIFKSIAEIREYIKLKARRKKETRHIMLRTFMDILNVVWGITSSDIRRLEKNPEDADMLVEKALAGSIFTNTAYNITRIALKYYTTGSTSIYSPLYYGSLGTGKTTINLLSIYGAMRILGLSHSQAVEYVSNAVFNDINEFMAFTYHLVNHAINALKSNSERKTAWIPVIMLDDISLQISKYSFLKSEREYANKLEKLYTITFSELLPSLKPMYGSLILTTPDINYVVKDLRLFPTHIAEARIIEGVFKIPIFEALVFQYYTHMPEEQHTKGKRPKTAKTISSTAAKKLEFETVDPFITALRFLKSQWKKIERNKLEVALARMNTMIKILKEKQEESEMI